MPDPGLTDLIAAHDGWGYAVGLELYYCLGDGCNLRFANLREWAEHVALVVEQHTNGRMAELEATIARVEAAVSDLPTCDKYEPDDAISCGWKNAVADVISALEGES